MSQDKKIPPDPEDADLEREIRADRKFSLAEAIGRMAGSGLLKGTSPITQQRQARLVLEHYLQSHLVDAETALHKVLLRRVTGSQILFEMNYGQPLVALTRYLERLLNNEARLQRFVTDVDAEWGQLYGERPYFQKEGQPPDQGDPYTFSSVRDKLSLLVNELRNE